MMADIVKTVLPAAFRERMQDFLQEEYGDFMKAYGRGRWYGLRYNPLKFSRSTSYEAGKETFLKTVPFMLEPVKWAEEGFYYHPEEQPGKHVLHEAGVYYIQEPSAMAVVEVLAPKPGEKILDLCAAPGGKSTQIAGKMMGEGLLVSNEINAGRAKILSQNIERMGVGNAVVCGETPERLAEFFPDFFDRVVVDAPCSGEGMFRKDETAIQEWSAETVRMCADRQRKILEQAALMLKPGGVLVYSTCTFSAEENEGVISDFIKRHEEFSIDRAEQETLFSPGRKDWIENPAPGLEHTMRLWPHKIAGEGHFIARLKKSGERYSGSSVISAGGSAGMKTCLDFLREDLGLSPSLMEQFVQKGNFLAFGEQVYLVPKQMLSLKGIRVIRPGLHLGTNKKNRFEPSHALALYLAPDQAKAVCGLSEEQAERYLKGESFPCSAGLKGWMLLTVDGCTIGFGKAGGGQMKNHYPKGLRK